MFLCIEPPAGGLTSHGREGEKIQNGGCHADWKLPIQQRCRVPLYRDIERSMTARFNGEQILEFWNLTGRAG